ncbi:MAG: site-specific DNA-methyltransferase [Cyanobacteria bacterium]|nr:site-specific DNA-methyltransferase [Cyanobacteriota bacterium]
MATGITSFGELGQLGGFELTYPNKASREEVLRGQRAGTLIEYRPNPCEGNLFYGDNLPILRTLLFDREMRGKVDLVYIDPPFATGSRFESRKQSHAYSDNLRGAEFLEFLRARLILIHELLSGFGSLYLHLDSRMICEAKIILDEVFGADNFRAVITRRKSNPKNYTSKSYGNIADYILFYSKTSSYIWNRQATELTEDHLKEYRYVDEKGRRHMRVPLHAPGIRNGETGGEWKGMMPPPGKHWQYKPSTLDQLDADGHIHWSSSGNPRKKVYLDEHEGVSVQDIWMDFKDAHNQNIKITGYPTEKNPQLLERIVKASSNEGSLVMDCFAGSGTTLDVAGKLGRRWIGVDESYEAIATICQRFTKGTAKMGSFRDLAQPEVQESLLFEDEPRVFGLSIVDNLLEALKQQAHQADGHQPGAGRELSRLLGLLSYG